MRKIIGDMDELEESKHAGTFAISPDHNIYGELSCAGQNTSLYLRDDEFFDPHAISGRCICGILHDFTKVTLIDCITTMGLGTHIYGVERYHFAYIFPHFVACGDHHIVPNEKSISEVHFAMGDATTLFYDFDAFGFLLDARPFIEQIAHANSHGRDIPIGQNPEILYFAGRYEIFSTETVLGRISASHHPSHNLGGPDGLQLKNTIFVTIAFKEVATFDECVNHTFTLLNFLGMLVGRRQVLRALNLRLKSEDERPRLLQIYWSNRPKQNLAPDTERPHPADVLLDPIRKSEAFSRVLESWFNRQQSWNDARLRFFNSFAQRTYSIDRLIGSANMFDILPDSAVPLNVDISEDLKMAKERCRAIFKALPLSPERDSVLRSLGRMGESTLKHKIRHRCQLITDKAANLFPDISNVTDEAVDCRNHYVHGSKQMGIDYNNEFDMVMFFTETLEFVFAASDMIEAGWDIRNWAETSGTISHPFGQYRESYQLNLQRLNTLLAGRRPVFG